eukprot:TRINITY_DN1292_c0_g1_i2.p1 TRINITY_DN1292_c0_g1~~TRINITY_DN1292_c0_g1_i2.p1  ORF type:complete len:619 (+),score=63.66 TRINITY_DN1292_c0_g1_i2:54-1859(+)
MDWFHQSDWYGLLPSIDSLTSLEDVEPLLVAAPLVPLVVKIFGLFKLRLKMPRRASGETTPTTSPKHVQGVSSVSIRRWLYKLLFLWYCSSLLVLSGLIAFWKGSVTAFLSISVLYVVMRQTTRPSFLYDLSFSVFGTLALVLLTTIPIASRDTLVSGDAAVSAFRSINEALRNTPEGGTVRILPGTYDESVIVSKNVVLQGLGVSISDVTIVGDKKRPGLVIASDARVQRVSVVSRSSAPAVVFSDMVAGAHISNMNLECQEETRTCISAIASHPLVFHHLTNISINDHIIAPTNTTDGLPPDTEGMVQATSINGKGVLGGAPVAKEVMDFVNQNTPNHLKSFSVVIKWLDVSAHWLLIITNHGSAFFKTHIQPRTAVALALLKRYGKLAIDFTGSAIAEGLRLVYNHGGHVVMNAVWAILIFLWNTVLPVVWAMLASYLNENQLVQLALHVISLLITILVFFSGNLAALWKDGGYLQYSLAFSRNIPVVVPILLEYGIGMFAFVCCYSILPIFLPFLNVYVTMAAVHIGLPLQATYTALKRFQKGVHFQHKSWWITLMSFRVFTLLHPTKVFVVVFVLYLLLQKTGGQNDTDKTDKKTE